MDGFWFILRIRTGFEEAVAAKCQGQTYVPRRAVRWFDRRNRANRVRLEVAFPGYLFAQGMNYEGVRIPPSRLVFGVLRDAYGAPIALCEREFERLKALEQELLRVKPEWQVTLGSAARAMVLDDVCIEGVVREIRGRDLAIEMPGSSARIVVRKDALQSA